MDFSVNDGRALQRLLDELGRLPASAPSRHSESHTTCSRPTPRRRAVSPRRFWRSSSRCTSAVCFSYATRETCDVCADGSRDRGRICVVGEPRDVTAIERTGSYHGLYTCSAA